MRNSFLIWIPSIQTNLRFNELTNLQYRALLKIIDSPVELEFFYHLNEIIRDNLVSKFDPDLFTTIDRFIISVFLKMHSCSPTISLFRKCNKCKADTSVKLDLNDLVGNLAPKIDRKFTQTITFADYVCICDIPTIKTEYDIFEHDHTFDTGKDMDCLYDNYLVSHIRELYILKQKTNFNLLPLTDRKNLFHEIPSGLVDLIKTQFLDPINNVLSDIDFLNIKCDKCKETFDFKIEIKFITDFIRILYSDNSVNSLLLDIFNTSSVDANFLMTLAPYELQSMVSFAREANKQVEDVGPAPAKDLFESPSEFT